MFDNERIQNFEVVFEDTGNELTLKKEDRNVMLFLNRVLFSNLDTFKRPEWLNWTKEGKVSCSNDNATLEKLSWVCANNGILLTVEGRSF